MPKQTISGLKELGEALEKFGKDVRDKDMNFATRKAAQQIQQRAKDNAPRDTGRLADNIVVRKDKNTMFDAEYLVGVRTTGKLDNPKNATHGYWIEYGTSTAPAQPFMRPAWDAGRDPALQVFKERIKKRVSLRKKQSAKGKL